MHESFKLGPIPQPLKLKLQASFFSSSALLFSRRSRPRVIIGFGSSDANSRLHTCSMMKQPTKSTTIAIVSLNLNCVRERGPVSNPPPETSGKSTYDVLHLDDLQPPVQLRHQVRRPRECDGFGADKPPVQSRVLTDALPERTTLEVDCKRRHLLGQAE